MSERPRYIFLLFSLSIFVLSQAAVLVRWADAPTDVIGFWRMAMTVPILTVWSLRLGQYKIAAFRSRGLWIRILGCAVFLFLHWRLWFLAVQQTTVANATVCFALSPLLTAIGALVFFGERIHARLVIAVLLGLTGVVWMEWGEFALEGARRGDLLGLLSTAAFAGYILVSKSIRTRLPNLVFTSVTYGLVGVMFAVCLWAQGQPFTGYPASTWAALAALTLGPTLLGHAVFTYCLNYLNVNLMTCATLFEPIFAAIVAAWAFGEPVRLQTVAAFLLVSLGVLILYAPKVSFRTKD
ncbi:MAG TPA: DMT family transporter [Bdellovibrionales bacterium]|nr:DMT family transporter [Bdellovibrionales bacterium]